MTSEMTRKFLDAILPKDRQGNPVQGHLTGGVGHGGHFDAAGKYVFERFAPFAFHWPNRAGDAVDHIQAHGIDCDVYICPYLMKTPNRRKGDAAWRSLAHSDLDGADVGKAYELGGFALRSGTANHWHAYFPLTYTLRQEQHERLLEGLTTYLGGDRSKVRDNDLLRPSGVFNLKPAAAGGSPGFVMPERSYDVPPLDPIELGHKIGVDLTRTIERVASTKATVLTAVERERETVDLTAFPLVRAAIEYNSGDRSDDTWRIISVCRESGLTLPQTRRVVDQRVDLSERVNEFLARTPPVDDVAQSWAKTQERNDSVLAAHNGAVTEAPTNDAFTFMDKHRGTDIGNAARFVSYAGHRLRYVRAWDKWLVYDNGRWVVDDKETLITEIAKHVSVILFKLAAKTAVKKGAEAAKPVWAWALKSCSAGSIAAMIRLSRGAPGIVVDHEQLDADPYLLNCLNGTIDLRTGTLRPHDPSDLCTMQCPVEYDPEAVAPRWHECLQRWQPDDTVLTYLQTRAGAGATGVPTETVDIDYGGGGNGKSKFHSAVQYALGPYVVVPHKSLLVAERFEQHPTVISALFRKRLAVASETKHAEQLNEEQVKNLTGGDRLSARRMREDPWEFWPTHTLVMFSNHKPTIAGRDAGVWRRLRLVPWEVTIPEDERDEHLAAKLREEAPGILRWIVDGAVRFCRDGLNPPAAVLAATAQYRAAEDVADRFITDVLDLSNPYAWCYSIDIKQELDEWCIEQSIASPPRLNEIAATLRERGCKDGGRRMIHGRRSTIWHGVCVTQTGTEA